ncbi:MAG TPA: hypothetical protein VMV21_07005, partial [Vicinamibacteria bacterium]|nr:hypothetical protein [Vicinamibacteria bacterium]
MRKALVLLLAVVTLPTGLLAQSPSLGEVAAQEKARREKEKAKDTSHKGRPKSFTDDDLAPGAKREASEAPPAPEPYVPSSTPSSPEGGEEAESGPKREWQ